jgi:glycosyltransferase involved in cell wall biosynthesis
MPRVSVVLPVYNAERYLAEALNSVLLQTFRDFELLVLDDGSLDRSMALAQALASKDRRVKIFGGAHRGLTYLLNKGIEIAEGEFVARMDGDDICERDRFEEQVRIFDAHPEYCAVGSQATRIDPDGSPIDCWRVPEKHDEIDNHHMQGLGGGMIHPSVMMRKNTLVEIGGYSGNFEAAEDFDLFLRLAEVGRLFNSSRVLLKYRLHAKSVTLSRVTIQTESTQAALKAAWKRRGKKEPLPSEPPRPRTPTADELMWSWALNAFAAKNFATARKQAFRLLKKRPLEFRRWILFFATSLGPVSKFLMTLFPFRMGNR